MDYISQTLPRMARLIDQTGVEIAHGDLEDKSSVLRAFEDVYGVFAVQTFAEGGVPFTEMLKGHRGDNGNLLQNRLRLKRQHPVRSAPVRSAPVGG